MAAFTDDLRRHASSNVPEGELQQGPADREQQQGGHSRLQPGAIPSCGDKEKEDEGNVEDQRLAEVQPGQGEQVQEAGPG